MNQMVQQWMRASVAPFLGGFMFALRRNAVAALCLLAGFASAEDRGTIRHEYWLGITGNALTGLTGDARFPASPSGISLQSSFATPSNMADSYGSRLSGYLYPPVTGTYRFWVAGDDQCELWLSTTDSSANKVLIASTYAYTGPQEWTKYASQQSVEITLQAGSHYYIEALHKEGTGQDSLAVAWAYPGVERQVIPGEFLSPSAPLPTPGTGTGFVQREWWTGLTGTAIVNLTGAAAFPAAPSGRDYLTSFEAPVFWGDNYGTRIRGFLKPTQTGDYRFWISGDDNCQLWLSQDADPLQKGLIATVPGHTATREWTKYPQQQSAVVTLQAGSTYYIEALHKEGGGGDSVAVAWTGPGIGETPTVITGSFLSPAAPTNPTIPASAGSGSIAVETWTGITGNYLTSLTAAAAFPLRPASRGVLTSFKAPANAGDNYGRRVRGYVCPAITGNYRFWIASDDEGELRLSSDENPANVTLIARVPTWTGDEQWDKFPEQQSAIIALTGGQRYYVEARQKDGTGGDNLAVAWVGPSLIKGVIPGAYLAPLPLPIIDGTREFTTSTTVTLSATVSGATIRYTTDGTTPTAASPAYASPITLTSSTVITAALDSSGVIGEPTQGIFLKQGTGTGLAGSYFVGEALQGTPVQRLDPVLQFVWGTSAPISGIPADHFSARWQGEIETQLDETYTLILRSDDGVRVWLDGTLLINDWTYHGATDRTCTLPPGRHDLAIEYMEGAVQAELQMFWQSAHQDRRIVPSTQLHPLQGVQGTIPPSSLVSPVYLEVTHETGASLNATVSGNAFPTNHLDDTIRYLNVPLDPAQATSVAVSSGSGASLSGDVMWAPTTVVGNTEMVVRKGDSLLLEFQQTGSLSITNYSGTYLGPVAVTAGQRLPVLFSKAGEFVVRLNVQGVEAATLDVTVVTADLTRTILCEVGFTRSIDVDINPFDAPLTFIGNSQLLVTTEAIAQDLASLHVTPLRRGTPRLQARIHGVHGPLVAEQALDEFTIDNAALHSAAVNAQTGIGTVTLVMRPYIPKQIFTMTMFAHTATFKGGATTLTINSTGGPSTNGEPPMVQKFDTATNETIGIFRFDLEIPENESKYCFRVARIQDEDEAEGGAYLPNSGSIFGVQASLPPSAITLLLGSHTGGSDGPTTNVNGDVCHVLAFASVIFMKAIDSSENESGSSSNSENWESRQWSLISSDYCEKGKKGDGNCNAVSYLLQVSDPPAFGGDLDTQLAALFGGSNKQSDCKTCSGSCGDVTPAMDSGTTPGSYTTSIQVCGTGSGDTLGDAVGGVFFVSKLDAHGVGSSTRTKFPDYAVALKARSGSVVDPVIQMESGGDESVNGCSLYGWTDMKCPPKNKWRLKAIAKDPFSDENLPEGYSVKWRLSTFNYMEPSSSEIPGLTVLETKNGQPEKIEIELPVGRWFPRLEIWYTDPNPPEGETATPFLKSVAEIHSLVVEAHPGSNCAGKNDPVDEKYRYGATFSLTNNAGGQTVDARLSITGSSRGRVSLDGYPQNQYWVKDQDNSDLPQVLGVIDGSPQMLYLQGYGNPSNSADDLSLKAEGQALLENCAGCSDFLLGSIIHDWQVADNEPFSSYDVWFTQVDDSGAPVDPDSTQISVPAPIISLSSATLSLQGLNGTLSVTGTIKSGVCDITPDEEGEITSLSVLRGSSEDEVGTISVNSTKGEQPGNLRSPFPYNGSFSGSVQVSGLKLGSNEFTLMAEDKVYGFQGKIRVTFDVTPRGSQSPSPQGQFAAIEKFANPVAVELNFQGSTSIRDIMPLNRAAGLFGVNDTINIVDPEHGRVISRTQLGAEISRWGKYKSEQWFGGATASAFGGSRLYIVDRDGLRVQVFNSDGEIQGTAQTSSKMTSVSAGGDGPVTIMSEEGIWRQWSLDLSAWTDHVIPVAIDANSITATEVTGSLLKLVTDDSHYWEIEKSTNAVVRSISLTSAVPPPAHPIAIVTGPSGTLIIYSESVCLSISPTDSVSSRPLPGGSTFSCATVDSLGHLWLFSSMGTLIKCDAVTLEKVLTVTDNGKQVAVFLDPLLSTAPSVTASVYPEEVNGNLLLRLSDREIDIEVEGGLDILDESTESIGVIVKSGSLGLSGEQLGLALQGAAPLRFANAIVDLQASFSGDGSQMSISRPNHPILHLTRDPNNGQRYSDGAQVECRILLGDIDGPALQKGLRFSLQDANGIATYDLLESAPGSRVYTVQSLRASPTVGSSEGYTSGYPVFSATPSEESFRPLVFEIRGVFSSEKVIPSDQLDIRTLDGRKRAVKHDSNGKFYLGKDDREEPAIFLGFPSGAFDNQ